MRAITFNTGRGYSVDGQIIIAWTEDEEVEGDVLAPWPNVKFHDYSRGISGEMEIPSLTVKDVMQGYDSHWYKPLWGDKTELIKAELATKKVPCYL